MAASPEIEWLDMLEDLTEGEIAELVEGLPEDVVDQVLAQLPQSALSMPVGPAEQASDLDPKFNIREHTKLISDRIAQAVEDVENGQNRLLVISTPPRVGKSTLCSIYTPLWIFRKHPDWEMALVSYDIGLSLGWSRSIRDTITDHPELGVSLRPDGGAAGIWKTTTGGQMLAGSVRRPLTGYGADVLIIDDPVKDYVEAHSHTQRERVWNWWLSVAQTRLQAPYLVILTMTRWHEDDLAGRVLSSDHEGSPADWEEVSIAALAEEGRDDPLERSVGSPLMSPLLTETTEEAIARWTSISASVGSYIFASMYQQSPSPAKGSIFDPSWLRYWTVDPDNLILDAEGREDPSVILVDPDVYFLDNPRARWLDSWDMAFKGTEKSDYVVGQRWIGIGQKRFLIASSRDRRTFNESLKAVMNWSTEEDNPAYNPPLGGSVSEVLIEDKANGPAIIDSLKNVVDGIRPITPTDSKEARARSCAVDCENGLVYLPHPNDPGNEWVAELLKELRNFPNGANDDQVDSFTQALNRMRTSGSTVITVPTTDPTNLNRTRGQVARGATLRDPRGRKAGSVMGGFAGRRIPR